MKIFIKLVFIISILLLFSNCETLKAKYTMKNPGNISLQSFYNRSELLISDNLKKEKTGRLHSNLFLGAEITGKIKIDDNSSDMIFDINKVNFISSSDSGYTMGQYSATGKLLFKKNNDAYECQILDNLEILDVIKGEIRWDYYYYRGEEGTKKFQERFNRINAVVNFLKVKDLKPFYTSAIFDSKSGNSFTKDTKHILFPELFGFNYLNKNNLLDKNFLMSDLDATGDLIIGEEVVWRKSYSKKVLPENLVALRNSGIMLKDYEEAIDIFFDLYNFDYYFTNILDKSVWFNPYISQKK